MVLPTLRHSRQRSRADAATPALAATSSWLRTRAWPDVPAARSRVSNGSDLLPGIDGRSAVARRYRDILAALASDQGGAEELSEARGQLCRRFAALAVQAEALEAQLVRGEAVDLNDHVLITSTLVRLGSRIGLDRRAKNVVPDLKDYLAAKSDAPESSWWRSEAFPYSMPSPTQTCSHLGSVRTRLGRLG